MRQIIHSSNISALASLLLATLDLEPSTLDCTAMPAQGVLGLWSFLKKKAHCPLPKPPPP